MTENHVCPWWLGYFLILPVRRWLEHPERLFGPLVRPGAKVLDFGAGMGYFSLPLARLVGPTGRVVCLDVQQKMLRGLQRRAARRGLETRIETVLVAPGGWPAGIGSDFDLVLAMHVIHEVEDVGRAFSALASALAPGGRLALAEPQGHVSQALFAEELRLAEAAGLRPAGVLGGFRRSHAALLEKPDPAQQRSARAHRAMALSAATVGRERATTCAPTGAPT